MVLATDDPELHITASTVSDRVVRHPQGHVSVPLVHLLPTDVRRRTAVALRRSLLPRAVSQSLGHSRQALLGRNQTLSSHPIQSCTGHVT